MITRRAVLPFAAALLAASPGFAQTVNFAQPGAGGATQNTQFPTTAPTLYSPSLQGMVMPAMPTGAVAPAPVAATPAGGAPPGLPAPTNPAALAGAQPAQIPMVPVITALDRAMVPLQQREKAWTGATQKAGPGQTSPGYKVVAYSPGQITRVVTRPAAPVTLILPSWERVAYVFPGPQYYSFQTITPNTVELRTNNFDYNAPLKILGQSGNLYVFMIDCLAVEDLKDPSDLIVQVQANANAGVVAMAPAAPMATATGAQTMAMASAAGYVAAAPGLPAPSAYPSDIPVPEEAKGLVNDPASVAVPHLLYERAPGDRDRIGPVRVWEDRHFTYLDFGDDSFLKPRPAISLIGDEVATRSVNAYEDPTNRRFVVLDRIGSFTLRAGQSVVCIIRTADARAGMRPVPLPAETGGERGLFDRLFGGA